MIAKRDLVGAQNLEAVQWAQQPIVRSAPRWMDAKLLHAKKVVAQNLMHPFHVSAMRIVQTLIIAVKTPTFAVKLRA